VAQSPGRSYNPLFIYSRSGLGKTHLLQAIGNQLAESFPSKVIVLVPTDGFESSSSMPSRTRPGGDAVHLPLADVLLIDDVQFLAARSGRRRSCSRPSIPCMEKGGQVVLTSDRQPKEIPSLSERLVTRFESGLIADIQPLTWRRAWPYWRGGSEGTASRCPRMC